MLRVKQEESPVILDTGFGDHVHAFCVGFLRYPTEVGNPTNAAFCQFEGPGFHLACRFLLRGDRCVPLLQPVSSRMSSRKRQMCAEEEHQQVDRRVTVRVYRSACLTNLASPHRRVLRRLKPDATAQENFALMLQNRVIELESVVADLQQRVPALPPARGMFIQEYDQYFRFRFLAYEDTFDPSKNPATKQFKLVLTTSYVADVHADRIRDMFSPPMDTPEVWNPDYKPPCDIKDMFTRQVLVVEGVVCCQARTGWDVAAALKSAWGNSWTEDYCMRSCLDFAPMEKEPGILQDSSPAVFEHDEPFWNSPVLIEIGHGQFWMDLLEAMGSASQSYNCYNRYNPTLTRRLRYGTDFPECALQMRRIVIGERPRPTVSWVWHPFIRDLLADCGITSEVIFSEDHEWDPPNWNQVV